MLCCEAAIEKKDSDTASDPEPSRQELFDT